MISRSLDWMVKNTEFRIFTCYADVEAGEMGTIYQALNFWYLGKTSGTLKQYFDLNNPNLGWFCDRHFRHWSMWKKYSYELYSDDIFRNHPEYCNQYSPNWDLIPNNIVKELKQKQKDYAASCQCRITPPKHKYIMIKGKHKSETKFLEKIFVKLNLNIYNNRYNYPKNRFE